MRHRLRVQFPCPAWCISSFRLYILATAAATAPLALLLSFDGDFFLQLLLWFSSSAAVTSGFNFDSVHPGWVHLSPDPPESGSARCDHRSLWRTDLAHGLQHSTPGYGWSRYKITPKCAHCLEMGVSCTFHERGVPCAACAVLGAPDCDWSNPSLFILSLRQSRDSYLRDERDDLVRSVETNVLPHSRFDCEYARSQQWFYDAAQGAITRFLINIRATRNVAVDGYRCLAASATNIPTLLRFIELGIEAHIHPLVLQVVGERVQDLLAPLL
ncbi:hypothetical protein B0H15DRAFT_803835 [Mycena belliarum]|uniref:Uncharacterized protein n=1 Tax=Mycena belliarum TaxID=1033014 RepID=A0AAD6TV82_9AGAR|nr:hypothetical protein B0H15DRAFT_803835 [Mycena belliae]